MPSIDSIAKKIQIKQRQIIEEALSNKVRYDVFDIVQQYLVEVVYNSSTPNEYDRSYTLLRSLKVSNVVKSKSGVSVRIYIPNEVQNTTEEYKMWSDVPSLGLSQGESPSSSDVAQILENGLNPYRDKADFMNQSADYIRQSNIIVESFKIYLKSKGINTI